MINFPRLLDQITPLEHKYVLRLYEDGLDEHHQERSLLRYSSEMPPHMFFNIFNDHNSKLVFEEDLKRKKITNVDFLKWWDNQDLALQEEALLSLILTKSKYRDEYFKQIHNKKKFDYKNHPLFSSYFKDRNLTKLYLAHERYDQRYSLNDLAKKSNIIPSKDMRETIRAILFKKFGLHIPGIDTLNLIEFKNVNVKDLSLNEGYLKSAQEYRHIDYSILHLPIIAVGEKMLVVDGYHRVSHNLRINKKDIYAIIVK